ncbi:MAG: hypothetical protein H6811_11995 [Phycisphaeraceae bacterium]|nr:hypothetical protein [Phycisphaeraceae bacterium]
MTPRALVVSLSITLALGFAALGLLWFDGPSAAQAASSAMPFRSADVSSLTVTTKERGSERLERNGSDWTIRWTGPDGELSWPADGGRARAGIRLLLESTMPADERDRTEAPSATVRIETESEAWTLSLGETAVGGSVPATLEDAASRPQAVRVSGDVRRMLAESSLLGWRSSVALPGLDGGASRMLLSARDARLRLAKFGGRWAIIEPISARADLQRAESLRGVLASLRFESFETMSASPDASGWGLSDPLATVVVEQDPAGGVGPVVRLTLEVGSPADTSGSRMFSRCVIETIENGHTSVRHGPVVGTIAAEELNRIQPNAGFYVVRRAAECAPPDVRAIDVTPQSGASISVRRVGGSWHDGAGAEVTPAQAERINSLIRLVASTECFEVVFQIPSGWQPIAEITLRDASGASLGRHLVAKIDPALTGGQSVIGVLSDGLVRVYRADGLSALLTWLERPN